MNRIVSTKYYYDEPCMKDQICRVCGTCRREYNVLVGKPERKGLLGICMPRCDHTTRIKLQFKYMGQERVEWINMAQVANKLRVLLNTVVKFLAP
jgi:hypothetical protein